MTLDLAALKVVDADTHLVEEGDLWTSRVPACVARPRPARGARSTASRPGSWRAPTLGPAFRGSVIARDGTKTETVVAYAEWRCLDDIHAGSYDVDASARDDGRRGDLGPGRVPEQPRPRRAERGQRDDRPRRCSTPASRSTTTSPPRCRSARATASSRWPSCPRGTSATCVREARRCARPRVPGREHHRRSVGPGRARPRRPRRGTRCGTACEELELPVHFHIGNSDTDDELLREVHVAARTTRTCSGPSAARCCSSGTRAAS